MALHPSLVSFADASGEMKHALKKYLPTVKSSHVSEAIAAMFRFQTNIALTHAIRDGVAPPFASLNNEFFFERLNTLGYQDIPKFNLSDVIPIYDSFYQMGRRDGARLDAFNDVVPEGWKMYENHNDYRDGFIIGMAETANKLYLDGGVPGAVVIGRWSYFYIGNRVKLARIMGISGSLLDVVHREFQIILDEESQQLD